MSAMASAIINDVRRELATGIYTDERGKPLKVYWPWLYTDAYTTTIAGSSDYALPTDYLDHMEVTMGKKKLHRFTQVDWDNQRLYDYDWAEQRGEPQSFFLLGHMIRLKPPPDGEYTLHLHYYALPSAFSDDLDFDYMSTVYPYLIIHKTVLDCAIILDDRDKIRMHGPLYDTQLRNAIKNERGKKFEQAATVMRTYKDFESASFFNRFKVLR